MPNSPCIDHGLTGLKTGYGQLMIKGVRWYAHRFAYADAYGPIPEGAVVRHTCDNPRCVNPDHLRIGTHADNVQDRVDRGRSAKGESHGRSPLTEEDVLLMRSMYNDGSRQVDLAAAFDVSQRAVSSIVRGVTWTHV